MSKRRLRYLRTILTRTIRQPPTKSESRRFRKIHYSMVRSGEWSRFCRAGLIG